MEGRTRRLHYTEKHSLQCDATVTEVGDTWIVTDVTAFHPEAGGQPCDHGTIDGIEVKKVTEDKEKVVHHFTQPHSFKVNDKVHMEIDAVRRSDHAQQHTGQHILSRVCEDLYNADTGSFHMPEHGAANEMCTIDLSVKLSATQLAEAEKIANEIIHKNLPVNSIVCFDEKTLEPYRKEARSFPKNLVASPETLVRIVNITGFDSNPCCGTHVEMTGSVGVIKIFKLETSRGGVRVHFMCGMRCFLLMQKYIDILNNTSSLLSANPSELVQVCTKVKEDVRNEKRIVTSLTEALLDIETSKLDTIIQNSSDKLIIHLIPETIPVTAKELRLVVSKLQTKCEVPIILIGQSDNNASIFLQYTGVNININKLVNDIKSLLSCKGGGAKGMFTFNVPFSSTLKTSSAIVDKLHELSVE